MHNWVACERKRDGFYKRIFTECAKCGAESSYEDPDQDARINIFGVARVYSNFTNRLLGFTCDEYLIYRLINS